MAPVCDLILAALFGRTGNPLEPQSLYAVAIWRELPELTARRYDLAVSPVNHRKTLKVALQMFQGVLAYEPVLAGGTRIPPLTQAGGNVRAVEMATLVTLGFLAAVATQMLDFSLGIPGHAIIRSVLPFSLGIALVPRRRAGLVMGTTAVGTALAMEATRYGDAGVGALTSLFLCGFLLDQAATRARRGWPLYVAVSLAGLATNLAAFAARAISKLSTAGLDSARGVGMGGGRGLGAGRGLGGGLGGGGGAGLGGGIGLGNGAGKAVFSEWLSRASISYPLCGLIAGLLCAFLLFRLRSRSKPYADTRT